MATKSSATVEADDLLFEIFLRLPSQSIQRFITVCKQWQSLMTRPTFRKLWRKRNLKPSTGILVRYNSKISESYLTYLVPFSPNKPTIRPLKHVCFGEDVSIIQSCNGFLLCSTGNLILTGDCMYYVYNPTTDTCRILPQVNGYFVTPTMSLAFDPNKSPHYKVITFIGNIPRVIHVYSSDTRCWKSVYNTSTLCLNNRSGGVYWNGAIHWLSYYFDIENEKFMALPTLPSHRDSIISYYFGESCERLIYATLCKGELWDSYHTYVYELKRDYSEWVSKHHVMLDDKYSIIISVVYGVEDDDSFLVLNKRDSHRIVRYNLLSKISEELNLAMAAAGRYYYAGDTAFQYFESLCGV